MKAKIWRKLLEIFIDGLLVVSAFIIAYYVRIGQFYSLDFPFEAFLKVSFLVSPIFLLLFIWGGVYAFRSQSLFEKFRIISISCLTGAMFFVLVFFFKREIFFSRLIILYIFTLSTFLVWGFHALLFLGDRFRWRRKINISPVLIIGANKAAEKMIEHCQRHYTESYPVAILAPYGASVKSINQVPILGKLDALEKVVKEYNIAEIYQCDAVEQGVNLLIFAEEHFLTFKMSPEILGAYHQNIVSENIAGFSTLSLQSSPLFGWGQFFKRIFDIVFSFIILLILLPVFLVILIIRKTLEPHKPVFVAQKRARGLDADFRLWRFAIDPQSAWGRFLRRNYFQDWPSFINVFFGDMSLVGPRPLLVEERAKLPCHFRRRLILRPGITGLWQLEKLRTGKDNYEKMLELDTKYVYSWRFIIDIRILIETVYFFINKLLKGNR